MNKVDQGKEEYELARLALQQGDLQSAFELAHRATEKDSHNGLFIGLLGEICYAAEAWTDARSFLELSLRIDPSLSDSLLFLGHVHRKLDQPNQATQCYKRILLSAPRHLDALMGLGNVSRDLGHLQDALDYYGQCLAIEPTHTACLINSGLCKLELGKYEDAVEDLKPCLEQASGSATVIKNVARAFLGSKDYVSAIDYLKRYLDISPDDHLSKFQLALCYAELKKTDCAVKLLATLSTNCQDVEVLHEVAKLRFKIGNFRGAKATYTRIIEFGMKNEFILLELATTLQHLGEANTALDYTCLALGANPKLATAHVVRASIFLGREQYKTALKECEWALSIEANNFEAHSILASILCHLLETEAALEHFKRAILISDGHPDTLYNYGLCLLLIENLQDGFRYYESRWKRSELKYKGISFPGKPLTSTKNLDHNKIIFVCAEQGFGDTIQFARYVIYFERLFPNMVFGVQKDLVRLLENSCITSKIITLRNLLDEEISNIEADYSCGLLSLPHLLELGNVKPPPLKLEIPDTLVSRWCGLDLKRQKPLIGLVWQGSSTHLNDKNRSINLEVLCASLPTELDYVCLQKDISDQDLDTLHHYRIRYVKSELVDFLDTASLCKILDLVIAVDTSVAHLAATLGVETWILIALVPDWRWGLRNASSEWYPSVKLYRQMNRGDWTEVLSRVEYDLRAKFALPFSEKKSARFFDAGNSTSEYEDASTTRENVGPYWILLGNALKSAGDIDEALKAYELALEEQPDSKIAAYNAGICYLSLGHFEKGWFYFNQRLCLPHYETKRPKTAIPLWNGQPVSGTIYIWSEQGLGDQLFFIRHLETLLTRANKFIISIDPRLIELLNACFPDVTFLTNKLHPDCTSYDFHLPLGNIISLQYFSEGDHVNANNDVTELFCAKIKRSLENLWKPDLSRIKDERRIGVSWKSANAEFGSSKSINVSDFFAALQHKQCALLCLQYGDVEEEIADARKQTGIEIIKVSGVDIYNDIEGLLQIIDACDIVFTVSNITAHLAGILSKPCVVLVPRGDGDLWYWFSESKKSFWYKSVNVIRQEKRGYWHNCLKELASYVDPAQADS